MTASVFANPCYDHHNCVSLVADEKTGLRAIIAIHRYGASFAAGGIRMMRYDSESDAVADALRLSRAMSYKLAASELPVGGAKAVIIGDPTRDKTPALLHAMGVAIEKLGGSYRCGADVGTNATDIAEIGTRTRFVPDPGLGDFSLPTALGVFHATRAAVLEVLGSDSLEGVRVAVMGLGQVGSELASLLANAGARLTIADLDSVTATRVAASTGAVIVPPDQIHAAEVDVFAPCALGGVLNHASVAQIRARIVCGAANNQLAADAVAGELEARGICYVPDFLANAGGVITGLQRDLGYSGREAGAMVEGIFDRVLRVLQLSTGQGLGTVQAANELAEQHMSRLTANNS